MHDEPVRGGAGLADVAHLGQHRPVDGLVQVGVAEDHERGVAAELHRHLEHVLRGLLDQFLADAGGAGEGQFSQPRVGDDRRAETLPDWEVVMTLTHPVGQPGLDQHCSESQCGQGGLGGGLDHHGAAGGQRRADLAGAHGEREVPRGDRVDRADGLLHGQQPGAAGRGDGEPAGDPDGFLGEPAEELGAVGDLTAGLGQRLAHFQGHQQGDVLGRVR